MNRKELIEKYEWLIELGKERAFTDTSEFDFEQDVNYFLSDIWDRFTEKYRPDLVVDDFPFKEEHGN